MISSADFTKMTAGQRRMAHRFKIKKPDGHFVPIVDPNIIKIDNQNTGAYDYNTTLSVEYKFFLSDVYNKRNRLIIVNAVTISHISSPVVTIIDLDRETISYGGRAFSTGWPTTVTTQAHNAYFNQETQKLYLSYSAVGGFEPGVLVIDCKAEGAALDTCAGMQDNAAFLDCLEQWTLPFAAAKDNGHCALITISGTRLYYFFQYDGADYATTGYPSHFGYFDTATGVYNILWTWGKPATGVGPVSDIKLPAAPTFAAQLNGLQLTDWEFNATTNQVVMDFKPRAGGISYGYESHIIEFALDEQADLSNPATGYFYTTSMAQAAEQITPTIWRYAACDIDVTQIDLKDYIDPNIDQLVCVYIGRDITGGTNVPITSVGSPAWESQLSSGTNYTRTVIPVDPLDTRLFFKLGTDADLDNSSPSSVKYSILITKYPFGVKHSVSVLSQAPLRPSGDSDRPTRELDACAAVDPNAENQLKIYKDLSDTEYAYFTQLRKCGDYYLGAAYDESALPLGLWRIKNDGSEIVRHTSGIPLQSDYIRFLESVNGESCLVACGKGTAPESYGGRIFYYDGYRGEFAFDGAYWDFAPVSGGVGVVDMAYTKDWLAVGTRDEIWIFLADKGARSRFVRNWWDGSDPDAVIGAGGNIYLDNMGRVPGFEGVTFQHSKGEASYKLSFAVKDACYLPWVNGENKVYRGDTGAWVVPLFNENVGAPGTFAGTLQDGAKIIYERGVLQDNGLWEFYPEGQTFICKQPAMSEGGVASMSVECLGPIGALLSRAIYQMNHFPVETAVNGSALTTDDNLTYWLEVGGAQVTDWATSPAPVIYVSGTQVFNYTLHTSAGTVTFYADPGAAVTADITYYEPGTNEAEDIILCILKHANEVGGAGLDESYFTGTLTGEVLTTTDNLTYAFSKSNVRRYLDYPEVITPDPSNKIYRDGVEVTTGFTWDYRAGTVTFGANQSAFVITGDCTYFTIQASGITLRAITFSPKTYNTAYDCINEVCRRVAPNYIFHELPDGRVCADFYTMQSEGSEDIIIDNTHIILTAVSDNPMRYDLATYVIGYGQAPLSELPNIALGKTVTDQWTHGWHAGTDVQVITDGSADTQATSGWGRWDEGTYTVQQAILTSNPDGTPVVYIDLAEVVEPETITFNRGTQAMNEGDKGGVCRWSLWESDDALTWARLLTDNFVCPPSQGVSFKAEINWEKGKQFRYLQVRLHDIGLYNHKGNTDSQIGLSEIQVFGSQEIEGISALISDTSLAENSEFKEVLRRWGNLVHVARNGQPDPALYTQDKVEEDAAQILNEMKRLLSQVEARALWLPGVPIFTTIKITNAALARTMTMMVESKTITGDGDTFTGSKYP